uniref:Uncharacterized protein LOC100185757 n=1 Tax=Phallusia mammillata TaxID=59560 RepID=A0A6F9DHL2_9ASCI|nr:uncharacterized protein LOC100185757 [Phallusia mammillata]
MESDGGGWTLVASVHENNIYGKCTMGDRWSNDQGQTTKYSSLGNWESFSTFGSLEGATSDDYKSAAYSYLVASDVMLWHVPNDVSISQWSSQAFLKYYTSSGFLSSYGGTLQILYSKHFPLKMNNASGDLTPGMSNLMQIVNDTAANIAAGISGFYSYRFDDSAYMRISDGGNDMYDDGNRVHYQIGNEHWKPVQYGKTYYDLGSGTQVSSIINHPFIMLMWIGNSGGSVDTFGIKVQSGTGADSGGLTASYSSQFVYNNITCRYESYNVYGVADPSICEVYFACHDVTNWGSQPFNNLVRGSWSSSTDNLVNSVNIDGSPQNVLMGYMLLSKGSGVQVRETEVASSIRLLLGGLAGMGTVADVDCSRPESISASVSYITGNNDDVMARIPPNQKARVTPGYIHFRPVDPMGMPNALCPGVKSSACRQQSVCIGGIKTPPGPLSDTCGDFSGWRGGANDNPTDTTPDGSARSKNDVKSTILIFTR